MTAEQIKLERSYPIHGDYTICMEMSWNGVKMFGMKIIITLQFAETFGVKEEIKTNEFFVVVLVIGVIVIVVQQNVILNLPMVNSVILVFGL
jgi:hypothetical protein